MLKTTKRYVFNSNRVNNYGFRILSAGIDQSQYNNNKVMLWMHYRPTGASKDEVLALGYVDDIRINAAGVMDGQPYFDDSYDFARTIYNKYENGTYNMFSLCALPIEMSTDAADMLPGQTGPTITKSLLKEISAVDIGGQPDAYGVELCDENGRLVKLSDIGNVRLKSNLSNKSNDISLSADEWSKNLIELQNVLKFAMEVGKIDEAQRKFFLTEGVKNGKIHLAKSLALSAPINPALLEGRYHGEYIRLACMKWDEIERQFGGVRKLETNAPALYKAKFYEKFGRMPRELKK